MLLSLLSSSSPDIGIGNTTIDIECAILDNDHNRGNISCEGIVNNFDLRSLNLTIEERINSEEISVEISEERETTFGSDVLSMYFLPVEAFLEGSDATQGVPEGESGVVKTVYVAQYQCSTPGASGGVPSDISEVQTSFIDLLKKNVL